MAACSLIPLASGLDSALFIPDISERNLQLSTAHGAQASSPTGPADGLDLRAVLALLRRHFVLLVALGLLGGLLGIAIGKLLPPAYTAEGLLVIDTQEYNVPELQTVRSERTVEPWGGRSEARVLTSRELVERVVRELDLVDHPAFDPNPPPAAWAPSRLLEGLEGYLREAAWAPAWLLGALEGTTAPEPPPTVDAVVNEVRKNLDALSEERSYAIEVAYTGGDPVLAADIVNTLMRLYIQQAVDAKREATAEASRRLAPRVESLRAELEDTQARIRDLEQQRGMLQTGEGTVTSQELTALAQERRSVNTQLAELRIDLQQIGSALNSGQLNVLNPNLVTPRLRALWEAEANLQRLLAESRVDFGPSHPRMIALQNELDGIQDQIRNELQSVRNGVRTRLGMLENRIGDLDSSLNEAGSQATSSAQGRSLLDQLRTEALSQQSLYDLYRERYEQTLISLETSRADARIVSRAAVPDRPSSPGSLLLGVAGGLFAGFAGLSWVFLRRWFTDRVEDLDAVQSTLGLPALGSIPQVKPSATSPNALIDVVMVQPDGTVCETVRGVLFQLQNSSNPPPKVVLVTSAMPQDGKSSLVISLARVAAEEGLRALAIEGDFRRPSFAKYLRMQPRNWLNADHDNVVNLSSLLTQDHHTNAHFLIASPHPRWLSQRDNQERLRDILQVCRSEFDVIFIDTPPLMKVVDPLVLAGFADAALLVVPWRRTSWQLMREAVARLETVGIAIAGIVMSQAQGASNAKYAYGDYAVEPRPPSRLA